MRQADLFTTAASPGEIGYDRTLDQWMTPAWLAEAIVAHALPDLKPGDRVLEPTCGIGRFLNALPDGVRGIGVEIDPRLAHIARTEGHEVVDGDIRTVTLPVDRVDAVIGNPPFDLDIVDVLLDRVHGLLDEGGPAILLLPAYALQTTSRVMRWNARWSMDQAMLPRTVFPGIRLPLTLATFRRDRNPALRAMLFYDRAREIEEMPTAYRAALDTGRSAWRAAVQAALEALGGEADLDQIYREMAPRRPTPTDHWKPRVRQQLQRDFRRVGHARYALAA